MPYSTCKHRSSKICWNKDSGWFLEENEDNFECWKYEKKESEKMTETVLPICIIEVEKKPHDYQRFAYIPACKNFICRTESGVVVPHWIEKETTHEFKAWIRVPADTEKVYVYGVNESKHGKDNIRS